MGQFPNDYDAASAAGLSGSDEVLIDNGGTKYITVDELKIRLNLLDNVDYSGNRTLLLTDAGKKLRSTGGTDHNITVPLNSSVTFPIGTVILFRVNGTGLPTIVAAGGVTLNGSTLSFTDQYQEGYLHKIGTNEWDVTVGNTAGSSVGDVTAPVLVSATVENANPDEIVLTYNEALNTAIVPATGDYTPSGGKTVTNVAIVGSVVTLTVNSAYTDVDIITISYNGTGSANPIQDAAGNEAADLSTEPVDNNIMAGLANVGVTFLGDSLTNGQEATNPSTENWAALATAYYTDVDKNGSGGREVEDIVPVATLDSTIATYLTGRYDAGLDENILCLLLGTNDIGNLKTAEETVARLKVVCDYWTTLGGKVILGIPPEANHAGAAWNVVALPGYYSLRNKILERQSYMGVSEVVDFLGDQYVGQYRADNTSYWSAAGDGVHYSTTGYARMFTTGWKPAIDRIIAGTEKVTLKQVLAYATPATTQNTLHWYAVPNATNYKVFRSTTFNRSTATQIYSGALLTYTDTGLTNGTTYYYWFEAEATGYNTSAPMILQSVPGAAGSYSPTFKYVQSDFGTRPATWDATSLTYPVVGSIETWYSNHNAPTLDANRIVYNGFTRGVEYALDFGVPSWCNDIYQFIVEDSNGVELPPVTVPVDSSMDGDTIFAYHPDTSGSKKFKLQRAFGAPGNFGSGKFIVIGGINVYA